MNSRKALARVFIFSIGLFGSATAAQASSNALRLDAAVQQAIAQSPEAVEAEAALNRGRLQSKLSLSPFLPSLAVEGGTLQREPSDQNDSGSFVYGIGRFNIYNGGIDSYNRQAVRIEEDRAIQTLALVRQRISRNVVRRYSELLFLDESLRLKKEAIETNKSQMQIARRKAAGGITSNADVLEFEFRENALNTEITLLQHERNLTARELSVAIGSEPKTDLTVEGPLTPDLARHAIDLEGTSGFLEQETLLGPKTDVQIASLNQKATTAVWLPKADLEARYGNMEFADPEVFGKPGWRVELKLTLPIFSGLETIYARQSAAAALRERESRLRQAQLNSKNLLEDRSEKLKVLEDLVQLQKENIVRAERYYKATLAEYRRGIKNSPDLSGATERLYDVRIREQALVKDLILARIGLISVTSIDLP